MCGLCGMQRLQQTAPAGEVSGGKNTKLATIHPDRIEKTITNLIKSILFWSRDLMTY